MTTMSKKRKSHPVKPSLARYIWLKVLGQAVEDLNLSPSDPSSSHNWFINQGIDVGSYEWVCWELGQDPARLRERYFEKIYLEYL